MDNELKNIAPELSKIKKDNPYTVPDGYFAGFMDELHTKIQEEENQPAETKSKKLTVKTLRPYFAIAAGFALLFVLWHVILLYMGKNSNEIAMVPDSAQVYNYSYEVENIDEMTVIDYLAEKDTVSSDTLVEETSDTENDIEISEAEEDEILVVSEYELIEQLAAIEEPVLTDEEIIDDFLQDIDAGSDDIVAYLMDENIDLAMVMENY